MQNERLVTFLRRLQEEHGLPALAGIAVRRETTIALAAVGLRRLGKSETLRPTDRFHTGSNAKAMTATLCAALVNRGLLSWESTPLAIFPELADLILPAYTSVTLEQLLRHEAGLPPYTDDEAADFVAPPLDEVAPEEQIGAFARWLLTQRVPVFHPGTAIAYSNAGYAVAAALAEATTGQTWAELLAEHLFRPLGITASAGAGWPARLDPAQPWGHYFLAGTLTPHPPDDVYQLEPWLAPAGDVSLSLPAYGRFLQLQLEGLQGKQTILPPTLIRRLHNDGQHGVGLGWGVTLLRGMEESGTFSTHAGSAGTFVMAAAIAHDHDLAVAVAANAGVDSVLGPALKGTIALFLGQDSSGRDPERQAPGAD